MNNTIDTTSYPGFVGVHQYFQFPELHTEMVYLRIDSIGKVRPTKDDDTDQPILLVYSKEDSILGKFAPDLHEFMTAITSVPANRDSLF